MKNAPLNRGPRLLLDAISVVFAVLVALAVDEWNEDRELKEQAGRAQAAVVSELQANREEVRLGVASSQEMMETASETLGHLRRGEALPDVPFEGSLPDFSDAAWETSRVTGIVAHMDYEWVLETAHVYETQEMIKGMQMDLLRLFGRIVARAPDEERFADMVGQLALLNSMQSQLGLKIDSLLVKTPGGADVRSLERGLRPGPDSTPSEGG